MLEKFKMIPGAADVVEFIGKAALSSGKVGADFRAVGTFVVDGPGKMDGHVVYDVTVRTALTTSGPSWEVLPGSNMAVKPGLPALTPRNPG